MTDSDVELWGVAISKWPLDELLVLPWHAALFESEPEKVWAAIRARVQAERERRREV